MKTQKQRIFSILVILAMAVILMCVFVACDKDSQNQEPTPDDKDGHHQELSATDIYSTVDPSVVFILISTKSGYSSGSGFFIDTNGTIVTNYHVIKDGLSGAIQLNNGTTAIIDTVLGFNEKLDIAILATSATSTKPVTISKTPVQIGDTVYAIGYPEAFKLGFSSSTFTTGMVSMNRSIDGYTYIQSTVDITHGNSGGALINKYGEVIGVTTAGITYNNIDYMNLSIPIQRIDTVSRNVNVPLDVVTKRNYPVYATFYSDGTKYTSQSVRYEGCAYEPTAPSKTGYSFAGWYADSSFKTKFNFNTKLTTNVSIYAKWNIRTYNINYNLNSGAWNGSSPSKTYTINDCEKVLSTPVRAGYIFEGWKNTSGDYISKLPTSNYLGDLSLTASWVEGAEGLTFTTRHSGTTYVIVTGYTGNSADVVIPKTYRGVPVECISASAFRNQTQIRSISLPDSLTSIESNAFAGCTGLTSIVIPDKVTSVNSTAFSGCINIATVSMPA
ncbi:MAG: trypsin-like peptidase domain-containing protein, partial [Firmicutes bacterium]|nr:trypsin-like peptidase domain-containing protein [Bacillota bacterium]